MEDCLLTEQADSVSSVKVSDDSEYRGCVLRPHQANAALNSRRTVWPGPWGDHTSIPRVRGDVTEADVEAVCEEMACRA